MRAFLWRAVLICCFLTLLCWCGTGGLCQGGGKLDDFEKDATKNMTSPDTHQDNNTDNDADNVNDNDNTNGNPVSECVSVIFQPMMHAIGVLGQQSWYRVADPAKCQALGLTPRSLGDPLLPFARLDLDYRPVSSDIHALDVRAAGGYGPVGVQYTQMNYDERQPDERMIIRELYGLYRISPSPSYEVDLGLGQLCLDGVEHTDKFSFTLPILIHSPRTHLGFEYHPVWADRINDQDVALLYSWRYVSLNTGYRWVESPHVSLNGPYVGLSWRL